MNIGFSDNLAKFNFDNKIDNNNLSPIDKSANKSTSLTEIPSTVDQSKDNFSQSRLGEYNLSGAVAKAKLGGVSLTEASATIQGTTNSKTTTQSNNTAQPVTKEQLEQISPQFQKLSPEEKKVVVEQLSLTIEHAGIKEPKDKAIFLSQVATETGGFTAFTEKPSKYASSQSTYKGRGPLQLTGEGNYRDFAKNLSGVKTSENSKPVFIDPPPGTDRSKLISEIKKATDGRVDAKPALDALDKAKENYITTDKALTKAENNLKTETTSLKDLQNRTAKDAQQKVVVAEKSLKDAKQLKLKAKSPEEVATANKAIETASSQLKTAISDLQNIRKEPPLAVKAAQQRVNEATQQVQSSKQEKNSAYDELNKASEAWTNIILKNPEVVAKSNYIGALSGVYYWKENNINKILDDNRGNESETLRKVSGKINTGDADSSSSSIHGFKDRKAYYQKAKDSLGIK